MKASQLRDLARRHAAGALERDAYIAERTRMIDAMVSGEMEIVYRDRESAVGNPQGSTARTRGWYLAGSLMLVSLLLLALLAYFLDDGNSAEAGGAVVAAVSDPGADLLQQFISDGQWSDASMQSLETGWNRLTPFQQESARRSAVFRQLRHETAQRIDEQEALLAAGRMEALLRAGRLREFSRRLGFETEE